MESAVSIQRALDDELLSVRIGLHTGGAFHSGDQGDYGGEGVHVAARVGAAAAAASEILVSEETLEGLAVGHALSDSREYDLKGLGASADSSHSTGADHGSIAPRSADVQFENPQ